MSKLRIFLVFSMVLLGVLVVFTVFRPMATGGEYSEVSRESFLETKDGWILQFNIMNHEGKETEYSIQITVAGKQYDDRFLIQDGRVYTYIHEIRRDRVGTGEVNVTIYKEGEAAPIGVSTYYLKKPASGSQ